MWPSGSPNTIGLCKNWQKRAYLGDWSSDISWWWCSKSPGSKLHLFLVTKLLKRMKEKSKILSYKPKTTSWLAYTEKKFIDNILGSSQNRQGRCRTRLGKWEARQGESMRVPLVLPPSRARLWTSTPPSVWQPRAMSVVVSFQSSHQDHSISPAQVTYWHSSQGLEWSII